MVNRIPNCSLLTNKLGLLNSLRQYERISRNTGVMHRDRQFGLKDFMPETYRVDHMEERYAFFHTFQSRFYYRLLLDCRRQKC